MSGLDKSLVVVFRAVAISLIGGVAFGLVESISHDERSWLRFVLAIYTGFLLFFPLAGMGLLDKAKASGAGGVSTLALAWGLSFAVFLIGDQFILGKPLLTSLGHASLYAFAPVVAALLGLLLHKVFGKAEDADCPPP